MSDRLKALVAEFNEQHNPSVESQALVLAEETGEACEATLALTGRKLFKPAIGFDELADELADVVYTAYSVADAAGIDDLDARVLARAEYNLERRDE